MANRKSKKNTQSSENTIWAILVLFGLGYLCVLVVAWREVFREPTGDNFLYCSLLTIPALLMILVLILLRRVQKKRERVRLDSMSTNVGVPRMKIDDLSGLQFENFCAALLKRNGYTHIQVTQASGDFGADIVAFDGKGRKWVFQCKRYKSNLGNTPIQEVVAAKLHYGAQCAGVITNSHFTTAAKQLARENGVLLIEREQLFSMNRVSTPPAKGRKKTAPAPAPVSKEADGEKRRLGWVDELEALDAALDDR